MVKLAGHERAIYRGPARVFDSRGATLWRRSSAREIKPGDVRRDPLRGPGGGPGMREMLQRDGAPSSARGSAIASRC